jgi:hypothetical protein
MKKQYGLIDMIHPTQITVGYAEVAVKMDELMKYEKAGTLEKYLRSKPIPCVLGPDNIAYISDHHHLGLALTVLASEWGKNNPKKPRLENPYVHCMFNVQYDFSKSKLDKKGFFKVLDSLRLLHPYNEFGEKVKKQIPTRLIDLKNDSYRALAGFVRKSGGYSKIDMPYLEFMWADFFREHVTQEELDKNMKGMVLKCITLALSDEAKNLPGWKGIAILNGLKNEMVDMIQVHKKVLNESSENLQKTIAETKETYPLQKPQKFAKTSGPVKKV